MKPSCLSRDEKHHEINIQAKTHEGAKRDVFVRNMFMKY